MIQRDWFRRQLEILAQAIGVVLGLKAKGEVQESISNIETAIQKAFGLSGKLALSLAPEDFISLACRGERPSGKLLTTLADLMHQWAALLDSQNLTAEAAAARSREQTFRQLTMSTTERYEST